MMVVVVVVVCLAGSIHGPWTQLLGIKSLKLARIGWLAAREFSLDLWGGLWMAASLWVD